MTKRNSPTGMGRFGLIVRIAGLLGVVSAAGLAEAQSPSNQVHTAVSPASSSLSGSGFDEFATGGWWGERQRLEENGISFNAQLLLSGFNNFQGGVDAGAVGASTFDLSLALDTEKVFHWKGGKFYVDLEDHAGRNPSAVLTGDIQNFDKHNSAPYLQIFEMWYQQTLFDGRLRLKLGKVDANRPVLTVDATKQTQNPNQRLK